jgi:hypothetical protein
MPASGEDPMTSCGPTASTEGWCAWPLARLELRFSARTADDWRAEWGVPPLVTMPVQYLTPAIEDRAVEVGSLLADRGQHRAPSIPDLVSPLPLNSPA